MALRIARDAGQWTTESLKLQHSAVSPAALGCFLLPAVMRILPPESGNLCRAALEAPEAALHHTLPTDQMLHVAIRHLD